MPITSSAKKAMRVSARRHGENLVVKSAYKRALKLAKQASTADAGALVIDAQSALDKAVKTKLLHRNTASRLLSRLTKNVKVDSTAAKKTMKKAAKKAVTKKTATKKNTSKKK